MKAKTEVVFVMPILQVRLPRFNDLRIVTRQLNGRICLLPRCKFFLYDLLLQSPMLFSLPSRVPSPAFHVPFIVCC